MPPRDRSRTPPPSSPPAVDADDAALFRDAIGPVRALPEPPPPPSKPKPRPHTRMAAQDEADALAEFRRTAGLPALLPGDALRYRREEVPPRVLQRLARGHYAAQDEIDLHHADVVLAERVLREFLREARDHGYGCVRIVHGKGLRAPGGVPVLKNLVDRLLRHRSDVLAFHSAPTAQGGTGAVLVLLAPR
jgi:DNA-nicking Smr family endonuclease